MPDFDIKHRKLRMAMIGGGGISLNHRQAARLDGEIELVAGAFSSNPEKSAELGKRLHLDPVRVYGDWREMLAAEAARPAGERVDLVSIVTPNFLHFEPAKAALEAGFHVVLDKPMTLNLEEARVLYDVASKSGKVFALTHTYVGYPMVKLARDLIKRGHLGKIRKVIVEYISSYLYKNLDGEARMAWRTDPAKAGSGCLGDIGTHAAILSETVTGLRITEVAAEVSTFVEGRRTDDDTAMLVHWENGVKGTLNATGIATGEENEIAIYVYGDKAGLEWQHVECEHLKVRYPNRPMEVWSRGHGYVAEASPSAARVSRLDPNHPEGNIEAFANIYINAAHAIREVESGRPLAEVEKDFPGIEEGLRGMLFVAAAQESSNAHGKWTRLQS